MNITIIFNVKADVINVIDYYIYSVSVLQILITAKHLH